MELKKEFYSVLKSDFIPLLKTEGFSGSGGNYRKVYDQVIHTINIQNNRNGNSCCINLGIHLTLLPNTQLKSIKEIDCEFRVRLAPKSCSDFWWEFSELSKGVQHMSAVYAEEGSIFFNKFSTLESIEMELSSIDFTKNQFNQTLGITSVRAALILAYIHQHQGNSQQQKYFANIGLENIGNATSLKAEFNALLKNT